MISGAVAYCLHHAFGFLDRERPKYQIKEDEDFSRNGFRAVGDASDTVKGTRDLSGEETVRARWVEAVDSLCFARSFFEL